MRQVTALESFEDIERAFARVRVANNPSPSIEQHSKLYISEDGKMKLIGSESFILGDTIRTKGDEFIEWCVKRVVPTYKAEQ